MRTLFFRIAAICLLLPGIAHAGLKEAGEAYDLGNYQIAFQAFQSLAETGNGLAQNRLGELYRDGKGTKKSPKEAATWFEKAAEAGTINAYANLARMYEEGLGVEQDRVQAFKWYYLGRTRIENAEALRRLIPKMDPVERAKAKNLARDLGVRRPSFGSMLPALRL
ncbi:MAG: tetratricopeptide repeat protein [Pseudomonadota bacterium]